MQKAGSTQHYSYGASLELLKTNMRRCHGLAGIVSIKTLKPPMSSFRKRSRNSLKRRLNSSHVCRPKGKKTFLSSLFGRPSLQHPIGALGTGRDPPGAGLGLQQRAGAPRGAIQHQRWDALHQDHRPAGVASTRGGHVGDRAVHRAGVSLHFRVVLSKLVDVVSISDEDLHVQHAM